MVMVMVVSRGGGVETDAAYARYELRVPGFAHFAAESLKPKLDDVYPMTAGRAH